MNTDLLELVEYAFSDASNKLKTIKLHDLESQEISFLENLLSENLLDLRGLLITMQLFILIISIVKQVKKLVVNRL